MKLGNIFLPKEVKILLETLESIHWSSGVYATGLTTIASQVEDWIASNKEKCVAKVRQGQSPRVIVLNLICYFAEERVENWSSSILRKMIADPEMERTRNSYASRRLGYGQVAEGDFGLIHPITKWIESVKQTAVGLPTTIQILKQLKASPSKSKHFAIWIQEK